MIDPDHRLPIVRQAQLLDVSRSSVYYQPQPTTEADLALMRRIDELHLEHPFAGSRMLRDLLQREGFEVGRKHVTTLMRRMGIEALYQKPRTSGRNRQHPARRLECRCLRCEVNCGCAGDIQVRRFWCHS